MCTKLHIEKIDYIFVLNLLQRSYTVYRTTGMKL